MGRPLPTFHDFVGQRQVVNMLRRQLDGAKQLGEPHPHTALTGPSGLGKTVLGKALANDYGTNLLRMNGGQSMHDMVSTMLKMQHGDFLFVDEAQAMRVEIQEMLLEAIDELRVPNLAAKRSAKKTPGTSGATAAQPAEEVEPHVDIQPFTLVLATNQPGKLCDALKKRMEVEVALDYYSPVEMQAITDRVAADNKIRLSSHARNLIAKVADGIPRRARHLVGKLRRHFASMLNSQIELADIRKFLRSHEIDELGLGSLERRYLMHLRAEGMASLESLTLLLGSDSTHVRHDIEARLQRMRFIRIGNGGRELTDEGSNYLKHLASNEKGSLDDDYRDSGSTAD